MQQAGFVLAGGLSRRMGRDKALIPYQGTVLLDYIASQVLLAAGSAHLIGSLELYGHLGYPVYEDDVPQCGPLGGICTALRRSQAQWNLIVACDLPNVRAEELRHILRAGATNGDRVDCVVPVLPNGGCQPLCALYHARCRPAVERALAAKRYKVMDLLSELTVSRYSGLPPDSFVNANTPGDWEEIKQWQLSR